VNVHWLSKSESDLKAFVFILLSALLVLAQGDASSYAAAATPKKSCCGCHGRCCVSKSSPAPKSPPAVPATPFSLKPPVLALGLPAHILSAPTRPAQIIPRADSSLLETHPLPLYERNCVYLI